MCVLFSIHLSSNLCLVFFSHWCLCLCSGSYRRPSIAVHVSLLKKSKRNPKRVVERLQRIIEFGHLVVSVWIRPEQTSLISANLQHDLLELPDRLSLSQRSRR
jgi:hypothetical protein